MTKKRIDRRVRTLIENGVHTRQRTCIVLIGDSARDQIVNLHFMLGKAAVQANPTMLWCYKKDLGFSSHKGQRQTQQKKLARRGVKLNPQEETFNTFLAATTIRFCYYKETQKILGNTYRMLVLQDFEALSPNVLARTVETVEGGGLIVFLLTSVSSLKQFYTMAMDIHQRFRTEAHQHVVPRFNERFLLSLKHMDNCLILDHELNVVPWALKTLRLRPVMETKPEDDPAYQELKELQTSLVETQPIGTLIGQAKTLDQAKALLQFVEAISERTLRSTVTLTAARGRGKSATLGLSVAAAVAYGYSNIFVTSPSPENLTTLFEFVLMGFKRLSYQDQSDYDIERSKDPEHKRAIVRINIFNKDHRQTVQYIDPHDAARVGNADLVVIDEAAAIPLPLVKALLGPYIVFMASTINGYEGTGRSLSLKLIQQLRQQASTKDINGPKLRELSLETPIRYAANDPVEAWLNGLLCLDSSLAPATTGACPHPDTCDLYSIDRDTLFSYNKVSELFLQRMVALYVSSHYKNSPNDLQLLSDSPAHRVFCLLAPITNPQELPEILCVIQVALEGEISAKSVRYSLRQGIKQSGDLIPWTMCQQYQDDDFGQLSGARIVRIATHPDYQGMGYGKRAIEQLKAFYNGHLLDLSESGKREKIEAHSKQLHEDEPEELKPRKNLPPLIRKLEELEPDPLDYIGVSFGATSQLYKFWKKCEFAPFYMRQTANDLTGEHTCIMLHPLETARLSGKWLRAYWLDFQQRYMVLLGSAFRHFPPSLALGVLEPVPCVSLDDEEDKEKHLLTADELMAKFTAHDLKRLTAYVNQMADFHLMLDLVPRAAKMYFTQKLKVQLSAVQQAILLGLGLQHMTLEELEKSMGLPSAQLLGLFRRAMEQINKAFRKLREQHIEAKLPKSRLDLSGRALEGDLDRLQEQAGRKEIEKLEAEETEVDEDRQQRLLQTFSRYEITVDDTAFKEAVSGKSEVSRVSIPRAQEASSKDDDEDAGGVKRRSKDDDGIDYDGLPAKKGKKGKKSHKGTPNKKKTPSKKKNKKGKKPQ